MSTALEAVAARWAGLRVCGVSLITNPGAGVTGEQLNHEEVLAAAEAAGPRWPGSSPASCASCLATREWPGRGQMDDSALPRPDVSRSGQDEHLLVFGGSVLGRLVGRGPRLRLRPPRR